MPKYSNEKSRKSAEYKNRIYDQGLCVRCRQPRDDERRLCTICRKKRSITFRKRTQERLENGLCKKCGKPQAPGSNLYCFEHWFKKLSIQNTGTNRHWRAIRDKLDAQNCKCPYSDKMLILGKNAQLDHKTPTALGGNNDPENLHWVDAEINRMKGKRAHEDFIALCQDIASRFP